MASVLHAYLFGILWVVQSYKGAILKKDRESKYSAQISLINKCASVLIALGRGVYWLLLEEFRQINPHAPLCNKIVNHIISASILSR